MDLVTEGFSPNQSVKQNQSEPKANTIEAKPEGQAASDFEKFARGSDFATPSGDQKPPYVKRKKRGRPRKYPKKIVQYRPDGSDSQSTDVLRITPVDQTAEVGPTLQHEPIKLAGITKDVIKSLSRLPATKFKSKALVLTDEESLQIADSFDTVINVYLPDLEKMDPKTAALLGLAVTTTSIFIAKIQAYELEQSQLQIKTEVQSAV